MDYSILLPNQLKQHLRSLRKTRGLTQAGLAQRLGVVQSRVADIEANPGAVSVEQLLQILSVLNAQVVIRDSPTRVPGPGHLDPAPAKDKKAQGPENTDPPRGEW